MTTITMRRIGPQRWYVGLGALMTIALAAPDAEQFRVDPASTSVTVEVGRSGLFAFAGHDHEVVAPGIQGTVTLDRAKLGASSVHLEFDAAALKVTGKGEPAEDVPEVQRVMENEVLEIQRHPTITFQSDRVSLLERAGDQLTLRVAGQLELHGVTRPVTVPVTVRLAAHSLAAEGRVAVRQTDFGIKPVSAGAGTVRVKDEVEVVFSVTARRE